MPSPIKLEDLATDMPISASSKAKAKQAVQSRVFQVPPVCVQFCVYSPGIVVFRVSLEVASLLKLLILNLLQVTQSLADVFNEFDYLGSRQGKPIPEHEI